MVSWNYKCRKCPLASDGYTYKDRPNLCGKKRRVKLNNNTTVVIPCGAYRKQRNDLGRTHKGYDNTNRAKGLFKRKHYTKKLKTWLDPNYWFQKEGWAVNVFNVFVQREESEELKRAFPKGTFNDTYNQQESSEERFNLFKKTYKMLPEHEKLKQAMVLVFYLYHSKKGGLTGRKKLGYPPTQFSNEKYTADELAEEYAELVRENDDEERPSVANVPKLEVPMNAAINEKILTFLGKKYKIDDHFFFHSNDGDFASQFDHYMTVFEQQQNRNNLIRENLAGRPEKQNSYKWKRDAFDVLRPFAHFMNVYFKADHKDVSVNRLKQFFVQISDFLFRYKTAEKVRTTNPYTLLWWNKNIKSLNGLDTFYEDLLAREREAAEINKIKRGEDDELTGGVRTRAATAPHQHGQIRRQGKRIAPSPERSSPQEAITPELWHLYKAILQLCDTLFQYRLNAVLPNLFKYEPTRQDQEKPDAATTDYKYFTELSEEEEAAREARRANQQVYAAKQTKAQMEIFKDARVQAQHDLYEEDRPEFINTAADKKKKMIPSQFLLAPKQKTISAKRPAKSPTMTTPKAKTVKANTVKATTVKATTVKAKAVPPAAPKISEKEFNKTRAHVLKQMKDLEIERIKIEDKLKKTRQAFMDTDDKDSKKTLSNSLKTLEAKLEGMHRDFQEKQKQSRFTYGEKLAYDAAAPAREAAAKNEAEQAVKEARIANLHILEMKRKNKSGPEITAYTNKLSKLAQTELLKIQREFAEIAAAKAAEKAAAKAAKEASLTNEDRIERNNKEIEKKRKLIKKPAVGSKRGLTEMETHNNARLQQEIDELQEDNEYLRK